MHGPGSRPSILDCELLALTMSTHAAPMFTLTDSASRPEISALDRAGPLQMQTHQEYPPRRLTRLESTLTNNGLVGSLECPVANSLDLKSPGIRASWPFGGAEVLWRSSTPVTPLECTDTKNGLLSSLECTDTNSLDLKFFRFHSYRKRGVGVQLDPSAKEFDSRGPLRKNRRVQDRHSARPVDRRRNAGKHTGGNAAR